MAAKPPHAPLLLVLPLVREDGGELDAWLGAAFSRAIGKRVETTGRRIVSADVATRVCKTLGIETPRGEVSEPDLEALLAQTGAKYLVHGRFDREAGRLEFALWVTTPDGSTERVETSGEEEDFQGVLDDVAARVLLVVPGGPVGEVARASMLSARPTESLDAFLALVRARLAWAKGDIQTFEDEVAAAVRLDADFVEPHEVVAGAARALGDTERVVGALRRVADVHGRAGREQEKATALLAVGHGLVEAGRWSEGVQAYEESSRSFDELGEARGAAQASMNIANVLLRRGDHDRAIEVYTSGLQRVQDFPEDRAKHVFNLGLALKETGRLEEAIAKLEDARVLGVELRDDELIASAYNALGTVYDDLDDGDRALQQFRRAEEHLDSQADPMLLASVKDHLGIILKKQGSLEEALDYSEQACQLFESRGDPLHLAVAYVNRAGLLLDLEREEEATPFVVAAHREFVRLGSPSMSTTERMLLDLGLDEETIAAIPEGPAPAFPDSESEYSDDEGVDDDLSDDELEELEDDAEDLLDEDFEDEDDLLDSGSSSDEDDEDEDLV